MTKKLAEKINFSIEPVSEIQEINPIISKTRVRIFYTGLNRNLTYITEEFAQKLLQTLPYTPVGGLWSSEDNDFSDHGGIGEANREKFQAFGVVPENPNVTWEDHIDKDGVLRRYACCDVFLWTARYQAAREIPKKAQSMELWVDSIDGTWKRDGALEYFEFSDGRFYGLVALGDDVEPCFEGAAFYGLDSSAKEFFEELKNYTFSATNGLQGGTRMELNLEQNIEETPVVENETVEGTFSNEGAGNTVDNNATDETGAVENFESQSYNEEEENEKDNKDENEDEKDDEKDNDDGNYDNGDDEEDEDKDDEDEGENEDKDEEDDKGEYALALQKISDLEAQVAEYKIQITNYQAQIKELTTYYNQVENSKKMEIINKYSSLLGEEVCTTYTEKIGEYSYEELKREISVKVLDENEEVLFNKGETKETVSNLNMTENYSGAARLMSKYYK